MDESKLSLDRRTVLRGAAITGAAVVAGPALAACGSDEPTATDPTPTPAASSSGTGGGDGAGASAEVLVATKEVPEGGGIILDDQEVVVTQPTAGEFVAFSSICTHQGCPVSEVVDGTINCPCHGSKYAIADGSVVTGPAPSPLPPVEVTVDGKSVVRA
jgi:Rieske Fe-S protein